jgi:hypothetical protein
MIVPAHDKLASTKFFARIFGLVADIDQPGYFGAEQVQSSGYGYSPGPLSGVALATASPSGSN